MTQLEEIIKKFREEYFDINTASGVNKKYISSNFLKLIEDVESFISTTYPAYAKEFVEKCVPKKNPNEPQLCQNRNGLDYCGTCEQGWEDCSCPARNTGFNSAISEMRKNINKEIK